MSLRFCYLALFAAALAVQSGCCCCCENDCWPNGKTWCGPSCGPLFWHEWFSHPPECCDPCDDCGNYIGPTGKALYYPGYDPGGPITGGQMTSADGNTDYFAPGTSTTGESSPELADPVPAEELPPGRPSAAAHANEFGHAVSYEEPVDSPRKSRKLGNSRRGSDFGR